MYAEVKECIDNLIAKRASENNPYYFQYGEKDSRYLGARDASERMKRWNDWFSSDFINYLMDERSLFQRNMLNDYYERMTAKAKADYDKAYTAFFDAVAKEARKKLKRDKYGQWAVIEVVA